MHDLSKSSEQPSAVGPGIIPALKMSKLRLEGLLDKRKPVHGFGPG